MLSEWGSLESYVTPDSPIPFRKTCSKIRVFTDSDINKDMFFFCHYSSNNLFEKV